MAPSCDHRHLKGSQSVQGPGFPGAGGQWPATVCMSGGLPGSGGLTWTRAKPHTSHWKTQSSVQPVTKFPSQKTRAHQLGKLLLV